MRSLRVPFRSARSKRCRCPLAAVALSRPLTARLALQEHITNTLQKQLSVLQNEKQKLERELQHEHAEHAAAMSRLSAAFTEKLSERSRLKESFTVLENQLEAEQELIVHRMGAQARSLLCESSLACFTPLLCSLLPTRR